MGRTSIPCSDETRDLLKSIKDERGTDWDAVLLDLAEQTDATADNSNEFNSEAVAKEVVKQFDYAELERRLERVIEQAQR